MSVSINRFVTMRKCGTCLIYHIDEGLCLVPEEAADRVTFVLGRLDQGGEFMRSECTSDQTSTN